MRRRFCFKNTTVQKSNQLSHSKRNNHIYCIFIASSPKCCDTNHYGGQYHYPCEQQFHFSLSAHMGKMNEKQRYSCRKRSIANRLPYGLFP